MLKLSKTIDFISTISSKNRKRKYALFLETMKPSDADKILDVGFTNMEFSLVDNYLEKNYPYPCNITALGIGGDDLFRQRYPEVKTVLYDGIKFPFDDNSFDIGWSNAVVEHVGNESAQVYFLSELNRVCRKLYFTTPNRYFPFELHTRIPFVHWLPKKIFDKFINLLGMGWATGDYMHLLSASKLKKLIKKSGITHYVLHKNRFCGFTMDFSITTTIKTG